MENILERMEAKTQHPKELDQRFVISTLTTPLHLEERTVGKYSIEKNIHHKGEEIVVVSMRNWL